MKKFAPKYPKEFEHREPHQEHAEIVAIRKARIKKITGATEVVSDY